MFFLVSCNSINNDKAGTGKKMIDGFYTDIGGFGTYLRIPLIKPYEAKRITKDEWRIDLQTPQLLELSIHHVMGLNVINNVIIIYAEGEVSIRDVKYNEAWFVIIPEMKEEKGFEKKEDFDKYLSSLQIINPKFYNVNKVYEEFSKNKKIDWKTNFL